MWIVALVAIVLVVAVTFASMFRIVLPSAYSRTFSVSDFDARAVVTFDGVSDMSTYKSGEVVTASVDPDADNFIGNLRVSVNYTGHGVGFIRVHVMEEWSTTLSGVRTVQPAKLDMPYTIGASNALAYSGSGNQSKWYDNRAKDHCYYYAAPVYSSSDSTQTISLIAGLDQSGGDGDLDFNLIDPNTVIRLIIEADVVQVNRYPQYWNMTSLPWGGSSLGTDVDLAS